MRPIVILSAILLISLNSLSQNKHPDRFILRGEIKGRDTGIIRLTYLNKDSQRVTDTAHLKNGKFLFIGTIDIPTLANLAGEVKSFSREDPDFTQIFLEPGRMTISMAEKKYKQATLTGSYAQKQWDTLQQSLSPILQEIKPLDDEFTRLKKLRAAGDTSEYLRHRLQDIRIEVRPYTRSITNTFYHFAYSHPNSFVSAYILSDFVNINQLPADSARKYYIRLNPEIKNSNPGKSLYRELLAQHVFLKNRSSVGDLAPLFTLKDMKGDSIRLSSFRGKKYILLDFWASWCLPCVQAIPALKKIYQQYHHKGFDIVSLSWDYKKQAWKKAIEKEGTSIWYNIYLDTDDRHNFSFISEKYGISSIPKFILMDKKGVIIGRYSWGHHLRDLNKKLNEIFSNKR